MKKSLALIFSAVLFTAFITSCASTSGIESSVRRFPEDLSQEIPLEELAKVTIEKTVLTDGIDNYITNSATKNSENKRQGKTNEPEYHELTGGLWNPTKVRTFYCEPGQHNFSVRYRSGNTYTMFPAKIAAKLEAGKAYSLKAKVTGTKVSFDIVDVETGKSAIPTSNLNEKQQAILYYVSSVLDKTSDENQGKVMMIIGNSTYTVTPGMKVSVSTSKSDVKKEGFIGFSTDLKLSTGKFYIKYSDDSMTKEDFLKLKAEECDEVYEIQGFDQNGVIRSLNLLRTDVTPNVTCSAAIIPLSK